MEFVKTVIKANEDKIFLISCNIFKKVIFEILINFSKNEKIVSNLIYFDLLILETMIYQVNQYFSIKSWYNPRYKIGTIAAKL